MRLLLLETDGSGDFKKKLRHYIQAPQKKRKLSMQRECQQTNRSFIAEIEHAQRVRGEKQSILQIKSNPVAEKSMRTEVLARRSRQPNHSLRNGNAASQKSAVTNQRSDKISGFEHLTFDRKCVQKKQHFDG
jgi:hypothetical protein